MPKQSKIKVTKFTYPHGATAWRVSGSIDGKQIRKNFSDRAEALEEKQRLEIRQINGEDHGRHMWVKISQEQHDQAWSAFQRLEKAGSTKPLDFVIDFYLKYYEESAEEKTLTEAIKEYRDEKCRDLDRDIISQRQYDSIKHETERFLQFIGDLVVGEIQADRIKKYLESSKTGLKTWNNRRGLLNTFFKFCVATKYAARNPIEEVPQYKVKHRRSTAETLSTRQVKDLMTFLESYKGKTLLSGRTWGKPGCMVPYFALALFAGIRPDWQDGELKKLRPEHIDFDNGVIRIEPEVSKVNEKRVIKLQPNLRLWLEKYPLEEYPIITPKRFPQMRQEVRDHFGLGHDVLRHTFISMLVGAFRSVGDASLQAGNSEAIIRRHYLDLKTTKEAEDFSRICPAGMSRAEKLVKEAGRYVIPVEATPAESVEEELPAV
ncbi:MAG: site-specific integrase [Opitutales bacterium]